MKVQGTQDCIMRGKMGNSKLCPVALALRDALVGAEVEVYADNLYFNGHRYALSDSIMLFTKTFDDGGEVNPFEIDTETDLIQEVV